MTISMYKASVPIFVQFLTSLSAWLDKAAAHAEAKKIDPAVLLNTRLFPDMFPLARQVRAATDHAINACGRLAGVELPTFANTEASIPELEERVAKTIEFIKAIKPAQIDGSEDKEITMKFASGERKFSGQSLLLNFCLPNFYFHATTAYDILRQSGVELGKRDFMGTLRAHSAAGCGLTHIRDVKAFVFKVMVFDKPACRTPQLDDEPLSARSFSPHIYNNECGLAQLRPVTQQCG